MCQAASLTILRQGRIIDADYVASDDISLSFSQGVGGGVACAMWGYRAYTDVAGEFSTQLRGLCPPCG